jgi:hypothetical protein
MIALQRLSSHAQISEGGTPPSFRTQLASRSGPAAEEIPVTFNVNDLKGVDAWQADRGVPPAVATLIDVAFNPSNSGAWTVLPGGERIWQLHLHAGGAIALMLYYSDFYIPEGGRLFIYNAARTQLLGAYTHRTHPGGGRFATEFVAGDELTLEYVASPDDRTLRIEIEAVGYGYDNLAVKNDAISLRATSGSCEVNVNCEEGDAWQNQKKGACHMIQRIGSRSYLCSAVLLNNTAQDLKPYLLSAQHCSTDGDISASEENMEQWVFYFHYELDACDSRNRPSPKTISGCRKIASTTTDRQSDGLLLLLKTPIPEDYNVYYNGWDRRNIPAQSGTSIHYPAGDYAKISTFGTPVTHFTFYSDDGVVGDTNAHWNAIFQETVNGHGVTEKGSSGAPLFNENKRVTGTLTGGNSTCDSPSGLNLYGKLAYHWDKYNTSDTTRMDKWLDPSGSGVETLAGRFHDADMPAPEGLQAAVTQNRAVQLTWKMPGAKTPHTYYIYDNDKRTGETATRSFTVEAPAAGLHAYSVSAVYDSGNESEFATVSVSIAEYKAPVNLSALRTTSQQVALLWDPPLYEQTIYWGSPNAVFQITLDDSRPFYFGQMWTGNDMQPFHKKTLAAVKFLPIRNNTYEIYVAQGERTYRQSATVSTPGRVNTVPLTVPFIIDGTQELIVAMYVSKHSDRENEYPVVCDDGPVVQGKGNLYSFDAHKWETFYDEENNPDEFNFNVFIAAIITSTEGELPSGIAGRRDEAVLQAGHAGIRTASSPVLAQENRSTYSSLPTAFPEITGYNIYRDNIKIGNVASSPRRYVDSEPLHPISYQVSAMFGTVEGELSQPVLFDPQDNRTATESNGMRLYPAAFGSQVEIKGSEAAAVRQVEIYAADGKLCMRVENPDKIIYTSSLQPGVYFFRIHTGNHFITLRGVKIKR